MIVDNLLPSLWGTRRIVSFLSKVRLSRSNPLWSGIEIGLSSLLAMTDCVFIDVLTFSDVLLVIARDRKSCIVFIQGKVVSKQSLMKWYWDCFVVPPRNDGLRFHRRSYFQWRSTRHCQGQEEVYCFYPR